MKRKLLLLSSLAIASVVQAQQAATSIAQLNIRDEGGDRPLAVEGRVGTPHTVGEKTAAAKVRYYNYVDHLALANSAILTSSSYNSAPYMWFNNDVLGTYTSGVDTITLVSIGTVLHPYWSRYNTTFDYPKGTMAITSANTYTVDSVFMAGYYGRNRNKPNVVDTLRVAITYGDGTNASNLRNYYYTSGMMARYNVDTLRSFIPAFDLTKHIMYKPTSSTGPAILVRDILLRSTDTGAKDFGVAVGMNVPAGNLVAATFTFRSGETYPPYDTVFHGTSVNPTVPFKYGMIRPYIYYENVIGTSPTFPTYVKGNYNSGQFERLPETDPQATATYSPNWAWTTNNGNSASTYQFPYVTWRISCPGCSNLNVANIENLVSVGNPYPNPANTLVTIPVTAKTQSVINVSLSNVLGQVIESQNLGQLAVGLTKDVSFKTASVPAGVYLLTVESEGEKISKRVAVTH